MYKNYVHTYWNWSWWFLGDDVNEFSVVAFLHAVINASGQVMCRSRGPRMQIAEMVTRMHASSIEKIRYS